MTISDNPFERWGLDPSADMQELTRQMKAKSRQLPPDERDQLQRDWRALTSDPVYRARCIALTPPPMTDRDSPWDLADELLGNGGDAELPALTPQLEDALVLPRMDDRRLYAQPPFLPSVLQTSQRHNS